jgi:hypothetical protein
MLIHYFLDIPNSIVGGADDIGLLLMSTDLQENYRQLKMGLQKAVDWSKAEVLPIAILREPVW